MIDPDRLEACLSWWCSIDTPSPSDWQKLASGLRKYHLDEHPAMNALIRIADEDELAPVRWYGVAVTLMMKAKGIQ